MSWSTPPERGTRDIARTTYPDAIRARHPPRPVETRAGVVEAAPELAAPVFTSGLDGAVRYARLLALDGLQRGLVGPHEAGRIWTRHLLSSAAVASLIPIGASVVDLGSGAGLPGIPLALARPDLRVVLIESRLRPVTFLREAVAHLGLTDRVEVWHGRAEEAAGRVEASVVTARAVANIVTLCRWARPLLGKNGLMLWVRGAAAEAELAAAAHFLTRAGVTTELRACGTGAAKTTVVVGRVRSRSEAAPCGRRRTAGPP